MSLKDEFMDELESIRAGPSLSKNGLGPFGLDQALTRRARLSLERASSPKLFRDPYTIVSWLFELCFVIS